MKYTNTIAIQAQPKQYFQPKPYSAKTPQEAADWGKDMVFKGAANGLIWFLQLFWPVILLGLLLVAMKFFIQKKKMEKYQSDKNKMHWQKQRPHK